MKTAYDIIQRIVLTEKNNTATEQLNRYCFKVHPSANKLEIKRAVEEIYKVKVLKVNTMHRQGKWRRERTAQYGRTSSSKRALVTLAPGKKIEVV